MEESNDHGLTVPCPECGRPAFRDLKFEGEKLEEKIRCVHCKVLLLKEVWVSKKVMARLTKILVLVLILGAGVFSYKEIQARKYPNCGSFITRTQAQAMYDSDKQRFKVLDKDNDGLACETYNYKVIVR